MFKLFLFVTPQSSTIYSCRLEDIAKDQLPPGTGVHELGIADIRLPPGRSLVSVYAVSPILLDNLSPIMKA